MTSKEAKKRRRKKKQEQPTKPINSYKIAEILANEGRILISSGVKGGVGKSILTMCLVEYLIKKQQENPELQFKLIETDKSNPDTARRYKGVVPVEFALFSEDTEQLSKSDLITISAYEGYATIINQPAQAEDGQKLWLEANNIEYVYAEEGIEITTFFVSNGEYDSMQLFFKTVEEYIEMMEIVFVANRGLKPDFSHIYDNEEFISVIEECEIPIIEIPKLHKKEREFMDDCQVAFCIAQESNELSVMSQYRVKNFIKSMISQLKEIGL